jgi:hypothetical protein
VICSRWFLGLSDGADASGIPVFPIVTDTLSVSGRAGDFVFRKHHGFSASRANIHDFALIITEVLNFDVVFILV